MASVLIAGGDDLSQHHRGNQSAASWGAILAGAFVATSMSLVLVSLGIGFEFASVSPWNGQGISVTTFSVTAAIWLIVTQWTSAALGGYIAGRLRTRWHGTHAHEVFFRDTAHGLVSWAVATVLVATVVASSLSSGIGGVVQSATQMSANRGSPTAPAPMYDIEKLFRGSLDSPPGASDARLEAGHILANAVVATNISAEDSSYLATLVAQKTGISATDAQKRVEVLLHDSADNVLKAKAVADSARKAAAETAIYTALSMLIGAFIASVSAVLGGMLRDKHI